MRIDNVENIILNAGGVFKGIAKTCAGEVVRFVRQFELEVAKPEDYIEMFYANVCDITKELVQNAFRGDSRAKYDYAWQVMRVKAQFLQ